MSDRGASGWSAGDQEASAGEPANLGIAQVSLERNGAVIDLRVDGEIDLYTRDLLRDALDQCVASTAERIVVDLEAVQFVDTGALSLLEEYARVLDGNSRALVVRRPRPFTLKLMAILSLDDRLRIEPDDMLREA